MKKLLFLLAAVVAVSSCLLGGGTFEVGNGVSVDTVFETGEFEAISSSGSLRVYYSQAEGEESVVLTCDENLVQFFQIEVEEGTLVIKTKPGASFRTSVKSYVTITSPKLRAAKVSGSGGLFINGPVVSDGDFKLKGSGSGGIHVDGTVSCKSFSAKVSGSGGIGIDGVIADSADFLDSGSGSIKVDGVTADKVSASQSGSGGLIMVCKDAGDIDIHLSGSGGARLSGNARSLNSKTSGSGRVHSQALSLN